MTFNQDLEKQINTSLIVLGAKIKALKSVLTDEQLKVYDETISGEKIKITTVLEKIITTKELDEVLKALDI